MTETSVPSSVVPATSASTSSTRQRENSWPHDGNEPPIRGSFLAGTPASLAPRQLGHRPVDLAWSSSWVVPHPRNRFDFSSHSPLQRDAGGSLKICVSREAGQALPESNWLPAPDGGTLSLTFRTYIPHDVIGKGEWFPPAHRRINVAGFQVSESDKVDGGNSWQEGNEEGQIVSRGATIATAGPDRIENADVCDWRKPDAAPILTGRWEIRKLLWEYDLRRGRVRQPIPA